MDTRNFYRPDEDKTLIAMHGKGRSTATIARKLGRSAHSVATRVKVLRARGDIGSGVSIKERLVKALNGSDPREANADVLAREIGLTMRSDIAAARIYLSHLRAEWDERDGTQGEPTHAGIALPHMQAAIQRYTERAQKLIATGTAPSAAVQQVHQETGILLNVDDLALRPAGEAAMRLLDRIKVIKCTA